MGDDHPCNIEGMRTVCIKMDDGIVRELKEVRYVSQLKRNCISVGALKILGLEVTIKDGCNAPILQIRGRHCDVYT